MSLESLVSALHRADRILVLTGAGVSTASGIPDFRGPQGIWKTRQPVYFDEFLASEQKQIEYWEYKSEGFERYRDAQPTATHRALAALERTGRLLALVTQNIDGLHQLAGSSEAKVIEVHGTARSVECLSCGSHSGPQSAVSRFRLTGKPPRCACGGLLKFATISFGQALRPEILTRAAEAARAADLVLALGSTLTVYPAALIPLEAAERGVPYIIVNRGTTDHDGQATLRIDADVDAVLPPAIKRLLALDAA